MRKYKTTGNTTLFDQDDRERKLTEMGDPLERLGSVVDFEMFRTELEDALLPKERKSNAGAKRYDVVMMFKLMVLQRYYNLSDEQAEFQTVDRTTFRRFLGLADGRAHAALFVTDHHQGGKAEVLTALDNLRDAVERYEMLFEFAGGFFSTLHAIILP